MIHLVDTGILVALLNRNEPAHPWVKAQLATLAPPLLTCEAVITEACFLTQNLPRGALTVMELLNRIIAIGLQLKPEHEAITQLMKTYADVPMSFADACLVRMSELHPECCLLTLDSDFLIYRRFRNQVIPTLMPPK